jgi:hypothetical protein
MTRVTSFPCATVAPAVSGLGSGNLPTPSAGRRSHDDETKPLVVSPLLDDVSSTTQELSPNGSTVRSDMAVLG